MIEQIMAGLELFAPGVDITTVWENQEKRLPFILMGVGIIVACFAGSKLTAASPLKDVSPAVIAQEDEIDDD